MLDGEAVMLREDGTSDFFALRSARARSDARLIAFDLLEIDGQDMRPSPLEERRDRLAGLLREQALPVVDRSARPSRATRALRSSGTPAPWASKGSCRSGKGSLYRSGPTSLWRKIRCPNYTRSEEAGEFPFKRPKP